MEETPILKYAQKGDVEELWRLLGYGASLNVFDSEGRTPLMLACRSVCGTRQRRYETMLLILRRSTPWTCRAVGNDGRSAADLVVEDEIEELSQDLRNKFVAVLLAATVPVRPANMSRAMVMRARAMVASHAQRRAAALAAHRSQARRWRAHETFVGLALDATELSEAEREVEEKRRRLAELEREAFGEGTSSEDESEEESEEESESDDGESESENDGDDESNSNGESESDDDQRAKGAEGGAIEGGGGGGGGE